MCDLPILSDMPSDTLSHILSDLTCHVRVLRPEMHLAIRRLSKFKHTDRMIQCHTPYDTVPHTVRFAKVSLTDGQAPVG